MHRLDRDSLFHHILNTIHCSRLKRHRSGTPIPHSLESHEGQEMLANLICQQIDNESRMVIQAEQVGFGHLGRWGIDEPVPATVPTYPRPSDDYGQRDNQAGSAKD